MQSSSKARYTWKIQDLFCLFILAVAHVRALTTKGIDVRHYTFYFISAIQDFITELYQFNQNQRDLYNFLVQKGMSDTQGQHWVIS